MLTILWLLCALSPGVRAASRNWKGSVPPCDRRLELLKHGHLSLGVRFSISDPLLAAAFAQALNFWASVLDMEWHEEPDSGCSIQVVVGSRRLFRPGEAARTQFPDRPGFQGWIAFNPKADLSEEEAYIVGIHELGHLFGLAHNPNVRSAMFFLSLDGLILVDADDLQALAARHKLRVDPLAGPVVVRHAVSLPSKELTSLSHR